MNFDKILHFATHLFKSKVNCKAKLHLAAYIDLIVSYVQWGNKLSLHARVVSSLTGGFHTTKSVYVKCVASVALSDRCNIEQRW